MMTQSHVTDWIPIDQSRTEAYAALTGDMNPIHHDPDFAATTPMGRPIAHGTLSLARALSELRRLVGETAFLAGRTEVRFLKPIFVGTAVRVVLEPDATGGLRLTVEREDGEAAIAGTFTPGKSDSEKDWP
ncbi:MAG: MaoC family dehydratase [Alphaproteobacteria bacterium]|jgi:acyl dehydratase